MSSATMSSEPITVRLETMTYGGEALGRVDGRAIFVTGGLPGEVVRVAITAERKNFARGRVLEVIEPSPDRITPRCPHFGLDEQACGGCHWQHIDYAAQLRFKRDIVRDQLRRLGKIDAASVRETIPSPNVWAYRNHAQFTFTPIGLPGFQAARSHRTVPIRECAVVEPEIASWLSANQRINESANQRMSVRSRTAFRVHETELCVSDESFFQVNTSVIETLVDEVLRRLDLRGPETVLDAYCGAGLFSRFIAPHAARVIGIEFNRSAIADARVNLAGFAHVELHTGAVEDVLPHLTDQIDALVVDPPRAGCAPAVVQTILARQIDRVVYVSCDPATLARDVRVLIDHGYALIDVQPVDLFPHTYHIETISLLLRANRAIL